MTTTGALRLPHHLLLAVACIVTVAALARVEGSWWGLCGALPSVGFAWWVYRRPGVRADRLHVGYAALLVALLLTDALLVRAGAVTAGRRATELWRFAARPSRVVAALLGPGCPHERPPPTRGRDELGRRVLGYPRGYDATVLVVGDSIMESAGASLLVRAAAEAGTPRLRVVDTSMSGYDLADEACVAYEAVRDYDPDWAIVQVGLNDFADEWVELDLGAGKLPYLWGGALMPAHDELGYVPLVLESGTRYVEAHREYIARRWGDRAVLDYADAAGFAHAVHTTPRYDRRDRALAGLAAVFRDAGVPAVFLVFPMNTGITPDPSEVFHREVVQRVAAHTQVSVDLRPLFRRFASDDLRRLEGGDARIEGFDVEHFGAAGLALGLYEALEAHDAAQGGHAHHAVREALLDYLDVDLRLPAFAQALRADHVTGVDLEVVAAALRASGKWDAPLPHGFRAVENSLAPGQASLWLEGPRRRVGIKLFSRAGGVVYRTLPRGVGAVIEFDTDERRLSRDEAEAVDAWLDRLGEAVVPTN